MYKAKKSHDEAKPSSSPDLFPEPKPSPALKSHFLPSSNKAKLGYLILFDPQAKPGQYFLVFYQVKSSKPSSNFLLEPA